MTAALFCLLGSLSWHRFAHQGLYGEPVFFISVSVFLLLALLILLFKSSSRKSLHALTINDFLPVHHQGFEEVDRRLSEYEERLKTIRSERRVVALNYLRELRTDFERLVQLLNCAAKFLPEITLGGESERFWAAVNFRIEYRIAALQILLGAVPAARLRGLTSRVRFLAHLADQFLNEIAREHGLPVLQADLNK